MANSTELLKTFDSVRSREDRLGVSSTRGMLWEIAQHLPERFQASKDALGLHVRVDEDEDMWLHIRVVDTSGDGFRGYTYALSVSTSKGRDGCLEGDRHIVETDLDAWFDPKEVIDAVEAAIQGATETPVLA